MHYVEMLKTGIVFWTFIYTKFKSFSLSIPLKNAQMSIPTRNGCVRLVRYGVI